MPDFESLVEGHTIFRQPRWLEFALLTEVRLWLCLYFSTLRPGKAMPPHLAVSRFISYERVVAGRGLDRFGLAALVRTSKLGLYSRWFSINNFF